MFIKNLSAVPSAKFAVTPRNPQDEFQNLVNLLANNQPMSITPDGTPVGTGLPGQTGVSQNPGSSLGGQQNLTQTTTDAKRFAGEGVPFSPPVVSPDHMNNVAFTPENMIHVSPVVPGQENVTSAGVVSPPSSLGGQQNVTQTSTDAKRFAAHWYESNAKLTYQNTDLHLTGKQLWESEKQLMSKQFPQAQTGVMATTGEVYWIVPVNLNIGSAIKRWTFMLKYDNNHPHADDWGGSVKAIPMIPSIDELERRAKAAGRSCNNASMCSHVPHIWKDNKDNMLYLCTTGKSAMAADLKNSTIQSAAAVMGRAVRWAYYYEVGLLDIKVWNEFCKG